MPKRAPARPLPDGAHSKSTPNLPTLRALNTVAARHGERTRDGQGKERTRDGHRATDVHVDGHTDRKTDGDGQDSSITSPSDPASLSDFSLDAPPAPPEAATSDESEDDSDNDTLNNLPPAESLYRPTFSRSNTYLGPATFAPPFYNRPPTPLPPSPSLTSLLRPNFSAATSRPTTPDPSSDEGGITTATTATNIPTGAQTPNSAAATTLSSSYRTARPIPRASPKVPTYEYYGFTLYLTSSLAFLIYLLWSFLPSPFLHQLGIYYYPNRWWSLAIPAWLVMLVVWVFVALASYNTGTLTLGLTELGCLVDEAGVVAIVDEHGTIVRGDRTWDTGVKPSSKNKRDQSRGRPARNHQHHNNQHGHGKKGSGKAAAAAAAAERGVDEVHAKDLDWTTLWNEGTDAVLDVPIGGVCEVLYARHGDHDSDLDVGVVLDHS